MRFAAQRGQGPPATSELPTLGENIRLVIWDLDETFWRGTLTEGGVTSHVEANESLVIELARRGVISSICSKNDLTSVRELLQQRGLWDYFVFPSVDWSAKGPRIARIIEDLQLRPETALFIDDNPLNRAEASALAPGLVALPETAIPGLVDHPRLQGKDDSGLTRLSQYKLMQRRKHDADVAGADRIAFLRGCQIQVRIEPDVEAHIDRAVELINRTNQLNFTKRRLPDDPELARAQLREQIGPFWTWCGLVHVSDRYGDHGYVGFFSGSGTVDKVLTHFCFSCRTLGMGVEAHVYRELGNPALAISGAVSTDLFDPAPIDWINQGADHAPEARRPEASFPAELRLRGGCELDAMLHYFGPRARGALREISHNFNHAFIRADVSCDLWARPNGSEETFWLDIARMGLDRDEFETRFLDPPAPDALLVLSLWGDIYAHHYRHKETGRLVAITPDVTDPIRVYWRLRMNPDADLAEYLEHIPIESNDVRAAVETLARGLEQRFDFHGLIDIETYRQGLRETLARAPEGCRVVLVQPPLRDYIDGRKRVDPRDEAFRSANDEIAIAFPFLRVVDIERCIHDDGEVGGGWHFDRMVYFRLYNAIEGMLGDAASGDWPHKITQ